MDAIITPFHLGSDGKAVVHAGVGQVVGQVLQGGLASHQSLRTGGGRRGTRARRSASWEGIERQQGFTTCQCSLAACDAACFRHNCQVCAPAPWLPWHPPPHHHPPTPARRSRTWRTWQGGRS